MIFGRNVGDLKAGLLVMPEQPIREFRIERQLVICK
jgi:hypothetical protein